MVDAMLLLQAVLIIGVFSFALYKENPFYRFCEHAFLGTAIGYSLVATVKSIYTTAFFPLIKGEIVYIIPIIFGLLLFARYNKSTEWISRWPIAVIIGIGMALGMRGVLLAYIVSQLKTTAIATFSANMLSNLNVIFMFLTTILVLIFFTFTILKGDKKGSGTYELRYIARILIMIGLGAYFGSIALARFTLIAGQIRALLVAFGLLA